MHGVRLVNRSGLRLSYWVDTPGEENQAELFSLNPWEESPLQVEPVEKTVILPDTQLQVGVTVKLRCLPCPSSRLPYQLVGVHCPIPA